MWQKVLGRTNRLLFLILYGQHRKRVMCIRCSGKVLPNRCLETTRGYTYRRTDGLEGFTKALRSDELMCHDIHNKSNKNWFIYSKGNIGGGYTDTQHGGRISLLSVFQYKESTWTRVEALCIPAQMAAFQSCWIHSQVPFRSGRLLLRWQTGDAPFRGGKGTTGKTWVHRDISFSVNMYKSIWRHIIE
jgi:hypothetical protein